MMKINIEEDKYKIETCAITDEECEGCGCNTCSRAIEKEKVKYEVDR